MVHNQNKEKRKFQKFYKMLNADDEEWNKHIER